MINILNYIHKSINLKGMLYLQGPVIDPITFSDRYTLFQVCQNFLRSFCQIRQPSGFDKSPTRVILKCCTTLEYRPYGMVFPNALNKAVNVYDNLVNTMSAINSHIHVGFYDQFTLCLSQALNLFQIQPHERKCINANMKEICFHIVHFH